MRFDKANRILILFICFQTVCQAFLVNSTNCMKVSPTAFPFSNKNRLTYSDRLHVFIHILFHFTFICVVPSRGHPVTMKHQLFSSVHSGHNVTADHALGHRGNVLYGNFVEDEVDEDNIKL